MKRSKKKSLFYRILPTFLAFAMMFSYIPVKAYENDTSEKENLALGKTVTASGNEAGTNFTADKITDGNIDRPTDINKSGSSRWASQLNAQNPWVIIDLAENKKFDEVVIEWERKNVNNYKVEVSSDNSTWTTIHTSSEKNQFRETLNVGAQEGRYVKITITNYLPTQEGSTVSWNTVSIYEVEIYNNSNEEIVQPDYVVPKDGVNISLGKTAISSSQETSAFTAAKAIDGVIDRKPEGSAISRWASAVSSDAQWLKVDLSERTQFDKIVIEWERKNSTQYRIQISDDNTNWTDVATKTVAPTNNRELISLSEKVVGRYVRLYIDTHVANADGVNWNNVSVFELELYNGELPQIPKTPQEVANAITLQKLTSDDTKLTMPIVPDGYEISFIGADYEEVIDYDMNIHSPLVDTEVTVNFEVKKGTEKATSPDINVLVPGIYEVSENEKPTVIPELREWVGKSGNFTISDSSRIVINPSSENELKSSMESFANDYKDILGKEIQVIVSDSPNSGDFYFSLTDNYPELRTEGYYMEIGDYVSVDANKAQGAFLATRSILQILKQTGTTISKGLVRDYPKFDVRGFMLDVGRQFHSLDYLYQIMKTMSWYKMNDLQVHLNDNYIWVGRDYHNNPLEATSGFRLESNDVGENGQTLTSEDGSYSKEEFGNFIDASKVYGVNIVPEIDSPGHALAFVKVHPEYAYGDGLGENAAMLDVTNPEVVDYIKDIFSEYTDGENPVFRDSTVHIGTDEFYGNAEEYRAYTDEMLKFMRDEKGRKTRLWGSLSNKSGITPVTSEGIEMNIWNNGWANPKVMYNQGYELINTDDAWVYIVPAAGYYRDYLDTQWLYNNYKANKFSNGVVIPAGSSQMRGGMFALWNDMIDNAYNGISEYDNFDRIYPAVQVLGEKLWGEGNDKTYEEFKALAAEVSYAPNTNLRYSVDSLTETVIEYDLKSTTTNTITDKSGNGYNSIDINNATLGKSSLKLNGGNSYLETPVENIGPNYTITFNVKRDEDSSNEEQILFESNYGQFKAVQKETGKVGFSREGYDYSFNYELPKNQWVDVTVIGKLNKTQLYINGEYIDEISKSGTTGKIGTFVFPLEKVGSSSKAFKGELKSLKVLNEVSKVPDETRIPQEQMTATATSEHPNIGSEGLASFAIDGNEATYWHTNWNTSNPLPQSITLNLGGAYTVEKFTYLPRANGGNGTITEYELQVSKNGTDFTTVSQGTWTRDAALKTVKFEAVENVTHVRLIAKAGYGGFASAAELNVHKVKEIIPEPTKEIGFKVTVPTNEIKVENNFSINVATKDLEATNMYAMQFNVAYDKEKVEFVTGTSLDESKYVVSTKDNDGNVTVVVATKGEAIENDKDIINLEFKAKAASEGVEFNITQGTIADDESNIIDMVDETVVINIIEDIVNPNPEVDKTALKVTIDYADEIIANGRLEGVVPAVVTEFNEALNQAKDIYQNADATEADVDAAFKRLINAIWMLEFKQGNKDALQALVDASKELVEKEYTAESWAQLQVVIKNAENVLADENAMQEEIDETLNSLNNAIAALVKNNVDKTALKNFVDKVNGLNKDKYTESTWKAFETALSNASDVLANERSTQEEVDTAYNTLVRAYLNLRLIPNKSLLEELINKVEGLDLSKYTAKSVKALNDELAKAKKVLNAEDANQNEIDAAVRSVNIALASLEEKTIANNNTGSNTNSNNTNSNNVSNNGKPSIKLPSTGAVVSSSLILILGATTALAGVKISKRRDSK